MATDTSRSTKTRKIAAVSAGALAVGLGLTYTLATWTDTEWVWGGADGIATSTFNVQQNTTVPLDAGAWTDEEEHPGAELLFSPGALALSPGNSVYAPVSLRTVEDSIGGTVELQGAVPAEGEISPPTDDALWNAVEVSVWTSDAATPPNCQTEFAATEWDPVFTNASITTGAGEAGRQTLPAGGDSSAGDPQHYCFSITLPAGLEAEQDLQGLQISPAWEFEAQSSDPAED